MGVWINAFKKDLPSKKHLFGVVCQIESKITLKAHVFIAQVYCKFITENAISSCKNGCSSQKIIEQEYFSYIISSFEA